MASNGLITDLYQLTMANALFKKGMHERKVVFDRFYRKNPFDGGYTVVAGIQHLVDFGRHRRISGRNPSPLPRHDHRSHADRNRTFHDHEP